jgi:hypothetical protein
MEVELAGGPDRVQIPVMGVTDHWPSTVGSSQLLDFLHAGGEVAGLAVAPELPLGQTPYPLAELIQGEPAFLPLQCQRPLRLLGLALERGRHLLPDADLLELADDEPHGEARNAQRQVEIIEPISGGAPPVGRALVCLPGGDEDGAGASALRPYSFEDSFAGRER